MAKYQVTASSLNVRKGPSASYAKVDVLTKGTIVEVSTITNNWAMIGTDKYCSLTYLSKVEDTTSIKASVSTGESNRPIYFLQTDSRWKSHMYSNHNDKTQTIGTSGCGPTSASMLINEFCDKMYSPVECCDWCAANGYRTYNNGSAWGMFKALAVKYGFKFSQTSYGDNAKKFLDENPNAFCVCAMGKGNWTSAGHYILVWKIDDIYVYVNDPASTRTARTKNTFKLLKSQCRQYFCFSYPTTDAEATKWAEKIEEVLDTPLKFIVDSSDGLNYRSEPSTSKGSQTVLGAFDNGTLVTATKKCGDWYYVKNGTREGYCAATYLEKADMNSTASQKAIMAKDALDKFVKVGMIDSPDYWIEHCFDLDYICDLFIKVGERYLEEPDESITYTVEQAINCLVDIGVINTYTYWLSNYSKVKNLNYLLIKFAGWIS